MKRGGRKSGASQLRGKNTMHPPSHGTTKMPTTGTTNVPKSPPGNRMR